MQPKIVILSTDTTIDAAWIELYVNKVIGLIKKKIKFWLHFFCMIYLATGRCVAAKFKFKNETHVPQV